MWEFNVFFKKKNDEIFLIIKLDEVCKSENKLNVTLNYVYSPLKKLIKEYWPEHDDPIFRG